MVRAAQPGVKRLILHPPPAHAHLNALGKEKEIKASIREEGQIQIMWQKQLLPFKQLPPGLLRRPRLHSPCLTVPRSELPLARSWFSRFSDIPAPGMSTSGGEAG